MNADGDVKAAVEANIVVDVEIVVWMTLVGGIEDGIMGRASRSLNVAHYACRDASLS